MIFYYSIFPAIVLYFFAVVFYFVKHESFKFKSFGFSIRNYYLLMSPFVIGLFVYSLKASSIRPIIQFLIFGLAGVIAEILVDTWWQIFYGRPLWVYFVESFDHHYSSWLNFIPWGLGGFLYFNIASRIISINYFSGFEFIATAILGSLIGVQIFLFRLFKPSRHFKFHKINLTNLVIFFVPLVIAVAWLAQIYSSDIYKLALLFAVVPTVVEYIYGKFCQFFISRKLWDYIYLSADHGHFTPLSIPLFCLGGFYFLILSRFLGWI